MKHTRFTFIVLALSGALSCTLVLAQNSNGAERGAANTSTASPTAENPNGGAATTGTSPGGGATVIAPSTRTMTINPDGTRTPASSAVDTQIGPGTSSGDINGTSQTSADRPNR